jgi:hypothetical protein
VHEHLQTGTGADLLSYETYIETTSGLERLTRVATADEEWVVSDWDNEIYYVRFDKNFSKKHLATFSKDHQRTEEAAYYAWLNSGKTENAGKSWETAEHQLLNEKMKGTGDARAVAGRCQCTHQYNRHPLGLGCNVPGCGCLKFLTPFAADRQAKGKPTVDPLAGASTTRTTFLVLNWVPRAEFEKVVVQSIQAHEKPASWNAPGQPHHGRGWQRGDPLAIAVGDEVVLKWDFGASRVGAIVQTQVGQAPNLWGKKQGCYVKAKKTATAWGRQTWQVFHMESSGAHAAF